MKKVIFVLSVFMSVILMIGCEENDPINELSDPGGFASSILFQPLQVQNSPINETVECEVEYWSRDGQFTGIEFLENITLVDNINLDLKDVSFNYRYEAGELVEEDNLVRNITHNFTSFVPSKSAFVIKPGYEVPAEYLRLRWNNQNSNPQQLEAAFAPELKEIFYAGIASGLNKNQLKTILVTVNEIVDEPTFEGYYENGSLTESGRSLVINGLTSIGIANLVNPSSYSYQIIHRVGLSFRITNAEGVPTRSVFRSFNVN